MFRLGRALLLREVCKAPEVGHLQLLLLIHPCSRPGRLASKYPNTITFQPLNIYHVGIVEWLYFGKPTDFPEQVLE